MAHVMKVAHRGMPRAALENTLPSFALALDAGADGIELDVHATRDGVVVVHHDPSLHDGTVIADAIASELLGHEIGPGITVPTLTDVCSLVDGRAELFVEVKGAGIERHVLAALAGYSGGFAIHSFDHDLVSRIHAESPRVRLGVLLEDGVPALEPLLERTGACDVWPHHPLVTRGLVTEAHGLGARVIPWTVNARADAVRLAALGVDALCGDDVRTFRGI